FYFYCHVLHLDFHSFPTRRSSDLVVVVAHRHARLVPHPWPAQMAGLDLERVVAAVVVGIEPFANGIADEPGLFGVRPVAPVGVEDRKSTRLNSSHSQISYAVFCLK